MQFTTILHPVRKRFALSCNDYCVADMIALLAANPKATVPGWCNASRGYMAGELDLSRQSIITILKTLVARGLVEEDDAKNTRTTSLWYDAVRGCQETLHVKKLDSQVSRNFTLDAPEGVKKLDTPCKETLQPGCKETLQGGVKKLDTDIERDNYRGDNKADKEKKDDGDGEDAGATAATSPSSTLPAEQAPTPPDSARPPASPKKTYGDGELQKLTRAYFRDHKEQFPEALYPEFLDWWTEIIQNSDRPADIGRERWRVQNTWNLEKRLTTWHLNNLKDQQKQQRHDSANRPSPNAVVQPGGQVSRPKSGNSRPVKRTPIITPDMLRRDGRPDRNAGANGDRRTIILDVDPGD